MNWLRRLRRSGAVVLLLCLTRAGCIAATPPVTDVDEAERRFHIVSTRLLTDERPGWAPNEYFAGEWYLVSLSMTALAALNLAELRPETRDERRLLVERLADLALKPEPRRFDTGQYGSDALETLDTSEGHVGALGHLGLVLGVECLLGGTRHRPQLDAIASALRRRFLASPNGLVDTFPGRQWVPDSAAALAAVELHARCRQQPSLAFVATRWPRDASGVFGFTPQRLAARGSGAGFVSMYLPFIDETLAADQWRRVKERFGVAPVPGLFALREWPRGQHRGGDMSSGPVLFGLSPSGTGFALAGAAFTHDDDTANAMLRVAETAGMSVPPGRYLIGPLVGDASVLAARTLRLRPTPPPQ